MTLIRKSTDLVLPTALKAMIYAQAGTGKTTLSLSAPKPLLLDFDMGVNRINLSHLDGVDIVQVTDWNQIKELLASPQDLAPYQTIVPDTVGKLLDCIIAYKCGQRQPRVQDWSGINAEFLWFTKQLASLNKHIIFIAHRDTRKEGDRTVFIPLLREKTYNTIITDLDLLGYLEMVSEKGVQKRILTFDPTDRSEGKNTCSMPATLTVPTIVDKQGRPTAPNDFIQREILTRYNAMLAQKQELQKAYKEVVADLQTRISAISNADEANGFIKYIGTVRHVGSSKDEGRRMLAAKVKELGLTFDTETKLYSDAGSE